LLIRIDFLILALGPWGQPSARRVAQMNGARTHGHTQPEVAMNRVNLDAQHEMIRQFVLELSASPDGTVLESGGQPVACVVPSPKSTKQDGEWTEEQNRRRCELIDRKYDHGLCPSEEAELALLQDAMHR
jgi:hypothetical protein